MKAIACSLLVSFVIAALCGCVAPVQKLNHEQDVLFQTSTLEALMEGDYDGAMTLGELRAHGDFGLGTFDALDGKMVQIDGQAYQIKDDGTVHLVDDAMESPFAVVTYFESDRSVTPSRSMDCRQLEEYIDSLLPTENLPYAIKVEGTYSYLKARSVPRQAEPYPPLVEVLEDQAVFELRDVSGAMVGFRLPASMAGSNAPGYHFHFISDDRSAGGHVLECRAENVRLDIDDTEEWRVAFPEGEPFHE